MSSLFRVRPSTAGPGGKILRGRRVRPSSLPYLRPAEPSPPSDSQPEGATWISGVISGAGRLISSVFRSHSPSPSPSSSYSSSEDEVENTDVSSKESDQPLQIVKELESVKDCGGTSLAIISEIESKHAIEQLLVQETFSRDEGNRLIKIIESRILDVGEDGISKDLVNRINHNDTAYPRTWNSLNQSRKLPEAVSYSFASIHTVSPSGRQVFIPKLRNSTVTESKKQLEDKMSGSRSKVGYDFRSCNSKTSSHQFDFEDEEGSPVDMAKSYMRTLPPWRSPSLSSGNFERTTNRGMPLYKEEAPYPTPTYPMPSSKDVKKTLEVKDQVDNSSHHCNMYTTASKPVEHAADHSLLNPEIQRLPMLEINSTPSDVEAVTRADVDFHSMQSSGAVKNSALTEDLISGVSEAHTDTGLRLLDETDQIHNEAMQQDGNGQIQNEPNGLRDSAKRCSTELNTNIDDSHDEEPAVNFNNSDSATNISERTKRRSADITNDDVEKTAKNIKPISSSRGGRKIRAIKDVPIEPPPSTSRGRGRRSAPVSRRGRGR